jgi:hypothetical protein
VGAVAVRVHAGVGCVGNPGVVRPVAAFGSTLMSVVRGGVDLLLDLVDDVRHVDGCVDELVERVLVICI